LLEKVRIEKRPYTVFTDPDLKISGGFIAVDEDAIPVPEIPVTSSEATQYLIDQARLRIPMATDYEA